MTRELNDWLDSYIEYTDSAESPLSYHTWCGLSVIAGALQRRVYLRWGLGQVIYPNLYAVLVGASGRTRKGVAISIAKDLLKKIQGISIAPESSSGRQAMILAMKRANALFTDPTDGRQKAHCSITAFSEELSVFLGQSDIAYLSNLTDWYDSKDDWEYESVGRGKDTLEGLCVNLMGATAPDWLQSMIPAEAVGGGFTSRIIFVVEEKKRKTVPEHTMTPRESKLQELLLNDLERISQLSGQIIFSEDAKQLYIDWYVDQDEKLSAGLPVIDDPRFAGYCERRATHIRKLMIISAVSHNDDLIIQPEDFLRSKKLLETVEVNMSKTFGGLGRAKNSDILENIKKYLQQMRMSTRKIVMAKFYRDITPQDLSAIELTLQQMGLIKIKVLPGTKDKPDQNDRVYEWIGE